MSELLPHSASRDPQVRTFLIADVRGYTAFTIQHGDEAAAQLASRFAALTQECVGAFDGRVVELRGDEALAVFSSARQALRAAVDLQARFQRSTDEDPALPLHVGIGLDAGEAIPVGEGYRGAALNLAARLCSAARSGESLTSDTVVNLARKIEEVHYVERGFLQLKGFASPVHALEVRGQTPSPSEEHPESSRQEMPETRMNQQDLPAGGYLGSLPTSPLVARASEVAILNAAIAAADNGEGRVVLLAGEPGAGKTRLAQEMTVAAHSRGFIVAAGRCYEPQQSVPFYPFLEALTAAYAAASPDLRSSLLTRWPGVAQLLPALGLPLEDYATPQNQQRLFWAVTGFFQALSEEAPLAILLDDLHWADIASVDLVQHLARHTAKNRVLLLGTYRDVQVRLHQPLHALIRDLEREGLVSRLPVPRLEQDGTAALIAATIGEEMPAPELVDLVYQRTEGNPFFVQQVMRMLVERGTVLGGEGRWSQKRVDEIDVPDTVRLVIGQRLANLSPETQEILHEASVLGQTFRFEDLEATSGRAERAIEDGLEEATAVGLIREAGRDRYGFDHALTQQALYHQLSSRKQRRLHLAAAEAIERLPSEVVTGRAAELAWHFLEADAPERALEYAVRAGDAAEAVFAHEDAAMHFHTALDVAQRLARKDIEAETRERIGGLLTAVVRYDEALPMLEQAAAMYKATGDRNAEARVVAQIGRVYVAGLSVGTPLEPGIALIRNTLDSVNAGGAPAALGALNSSLARLLYVAGRYDEALDTANQAATFAQTAGSGGLEAEAQVTAGASLPLLGRWSEGLARLIQGVSRAEQVNDVFSACRGLQHLSMVRLAHGELTKSNESMTRSLALAERMSNRRQIAATLFGLGYIAFLSGDVSRSTHLSQRARHHMGQVGGLWIRLLHGAGVSLLHGLDEWNSMPAPLQECIEISEGVDALHELRRQRLAAEHALISGDPQAAYERLNALRNDSRLQAEQRFALIPLSTTVLIALGHVEEAREELTSGLRHVQEQNLRILQPDFLCVQAQLTAVAGAHEVAEKTFEGAASIAEELSYPASEIRVRQAWRKFLEGSGQAVKGMEQQKRVDALHDHMTSGASIIGG